MSNVAWPAYWPFDLEYPLLQLKRIYSGSQMKILNKIFLKKSKLNKDESNNIKKDISTVKEDIVTIEPKEGEYDIVEIEILPEKMLCPDCGGITLVGLDFCDKCGGELSSYES